MEFAIISCLLDLKANFLDIIKLNKNNNKLHLKSYNFDQSNIALGYSPFRIIWYHHSNKQIEPY